MNKTQTNTCQSDDGHDRSVGCSDDLPETHPEGLLIATAVCEARAGGLGLADATAVVTPVDLRFVKAKHDHWSARKDK